MKQGFTSLAVFSDEELIEELARRYNNRPMEEIKHWCEECKNFRFWESVAPVPDSYNPCVKKHHMKFYVPREYDNPHDGGYYLPVCADRKVSA